jgi:hypothetical protein
MPSSVPSGSVLGRFVEPPTPSRRSSISTSNTGCAMASSNVDMPYHKKFGREPLDSELSLLSDDACMAASSSTTGAAALAVGSASAPVRLHLRVHGAAAEDKEGKLSLAWYGGNCAIICNLVGGQNR